MPILKVRRVQKLQFTPSPKGVKTVIKEDKPKSITPERQQQLIYGECTTYHINDIPNRLKELEARGHTLI